MLVEGQLISRLSGSSVIFLSNNSVAVIKEESSNSSSDTNTGTEQTSAEVTQAASDESSETIEQKTVETGSDTQKSSETGDTGTESGTEVSTTPAPDTEKPQTEGAAGGDTVEIEGDTGVVQSSGAVAADPAMAEGTQVDPTMQAGMTGGKDTLLSSWPFVGGVSIAIILVSIAIGTFLARRKIKKGIEIYED